MKLDFTKKKLLKESWMRAMASWNNTFLKYLYDNDVTLTADLEAHKKLEEDEGIISYGAFKADEENIVLFEFWDSHDAKHDFDEKLNSDVNIYEKFMPLMNGFDDYYGEPYALKQFVDFKAGNTI